VLGFFPAESSEIASAFGTSSRTSGPSWPVGALRWITFGHLEADECSAMNLFLGAAPHAQVRAWPGWLRGQYRRSADRPPRPRKDDIPSAALPRHTACPACWDAGVYFDEITGTLLCGDLFTAVGQSRALGSSELVGPAIVAEDMLAATCPTPQTGATMRRLAELLRT
jgi:hypothetical protein